MYGYYPMGFYFDPTYILVLIGAIFSIIASAKMNSTFQKYSQIRSMAGLSGAEAARRILDQAGVIGVPVERVSGRLTDHYDPRSRVLRLSDSTYNSTSVAAIGVAAHECGHAIQHHEGYSPLSFRNALAPAAGIGSRLGIPIILIGMLFGGNGLLVTIGIWVFSLAVLFQVVTLPVEYNASSRAAALLDQYGIMGTQEVEGCKKVLNAAALTYVAAAAASILSLLRLLLLFGRRNDD